MRSEGDERQEMPCRWAEKCIVAGTARSNLVVRCRGLRDSGIMRAKVSLGEAAIHQALLGGA